MSNQDEESKDANLPSYQFFTPDLNYNFFTDPATAADAPLSVTPSTLPTTTTPDTVTSSFLSKSTTSAPAPVMPTIKPYTYVPVVTTPAPVTPSVSMLDVSKFVQDVPVVPYTPASTNFIANLAATAPAPVVEAESERVPYSLVDEAPEPTFEERVAAMEREIAVADAASAAAQAAQTAAQAASTKAAGEAAASIADAIPSNPFVVETPIFQSYAAAPQPAVLQQPISIPDPIETARDSEGKWNTFNEPTRVPDVCSASFNFNKSLLKVFWRIDIDHNNRVSKNELALALQEHWFEGDEKILAKMLYDMYEDISPEAIFCDAGLSVNNILSFGPFGDMIASEMEPEIPEPDPRQQRDTVAPPKKKNTKSSQSLRSLFKR